MQPKVHVCRLHGWTECQRLMPPGHWSARHLPNSERSFVLRTMSAICTGIVTPAKTLVGVVAKDPCLQATRSRDTFQAKSKRPRECQRDTSTTMVEPIAEVNVCGLLGGMTPCKLRLNPTGYAAPSLSNSSCACSQLVATGQCPQAAAQTPVDPVTTGQGL